MHGQYRVKILSAFYHNKNILHVLGKPYVQFGLNITRSELINMERIENFDHHGNFCFIDNEAVAFRNLFWLEQVCSVTEVLDSTTVPSCAPNVWALTSVDFLPIVNVTIIRNGDNSPKTDKEIK